MKGYISGLLSALMLAAAPALAQAPAAKPAPVKVTIDSGVLVGESSGGVNVFRGVPFAKPPLIAPLVRLLRQDRRTRLDFGLGGGGSGNRLAVLIQRRHGFSAR